MLLATMAPTYTNDSCVNSRNGDRETSRPRNLHTGKRERGGERLEGWGEEVGTQNYN